MRADLKPDHRRKIAVGACGQKQARYGNHNKKCVEEELLESPGKFERLGVDPFASILRTRRARLSTIRAS